MSPAPPVKAFFTRRDLHEPGRSRAELEHLAAATLPLATLTWRRENALRLGPDRDTQFLELEREDLVARIETASGLQADLRPMRVERVVGSPDESVEACDAELRLLAWPAWAEAEDAWARVATTFDTLGYDERTFDWSFLFADVLAALAARGEEAQVPALVARRRARLLERWREPAFCEVDLGQSAFLDLGPMLASVPTPGRVASLQLHRCELDALPREVERFQAVRSLNLHGNRLTFVPELLERLPALEVVNLWRNPVAADAAAIAAFEARRPGVRLAR
jgi:hypothetical protein